MNEQRKIGRKTFANYTKIDVILRILKSFDCMLRKFCTAFDLKVQISLIMSHFQWKLSIQIQTKQFHQFILCTVSSEKYNILYFDRWCSLLWKFLFPNQSTNHNLDDEWNDSLLKDRNLKKKIVVKKERVTLLFLFDIVVFYLKIFLFFYSNKWAENKLRYWIMGIGSTKILSYDEASKRCKNSNSIEKNKLIQWISFI